MSKANVTAKKEDGMLQRLLGRKAAKETAKMSATVSGTSLPVSPATDVQYLHAAHEEQLRLLTEAREQLQKSEERYRAFIRQSTEGIWRFETAHPIPVDLAEDEQIDAFFRLAHLAECNDTLAKMYGYASAADMQGAKLSQFLLRDDPRNIDYLRAFIRSGYTLADAESHETDKEGNEKWFLNSLTGTVENGRLTGAWGVQRDITDRKKAEQEIHLLNLELEQKVAARTQELQEARERDLVNLHRLKAMMAHLPMAAVALDQEERVLQVNEIFRLLFALPESTESMVGKSIWDFTGHFASQLIDGEDRTRLIGEHVRNREGLLGSELQMRDGRTFVRDYIPVFDGERFHGHLFLYRDITQERRVDATKSEFMSLASHQLRTPLTAIRWTFGRLGRSLGDRARPTERDLIKEGKAAATRMSETIDTMLAISRIESGAMRPQHASIPLCSLVRETVDVFREDLQHKNQELVTDCPEELRVASDPHFLKEIISNLLENAIKYTPPGGRITASVRRTDAGVRIEVRDTGYGIPSHQQTNIFRKFFRGENVATKVTEGSGLGLYLVSLMAGLLHAQVSFASEEGKGTVFTIDLPADIDVNN